MKGMDAATRLVWEAIKNQSTIVIYGDYDVDGVTATALLTRFFSELHTNCTPCHPDRFRHGYGLKAELVQAASPARPGLVITVDCGISDRIEVGRLVDLGWQVIVTDHHQPPSELPDAHAIINPWQEGCSFPIKNLAGVGVAFYLAMGIRSHLHRQNFWADHPPPNLKKYLDLVAVGTISDMVPLRGINRLLTKVGLAVLAKTENRGLAELLKQCHLPKGHHVSHEDIAFQIGPRLNAAGRMGEASRASTLLSSNDETLVANLANIIEQTNLDRRVQTSELVEQAIASVRAQNDSDAPCVIVHGHDWHQGLLGIAASRLVDIYRKPVFILGGRGIVKGSVRSVPGIDIHELIADCASEGKVLEYGGHCSAAGLSIYEKDVGLLRDTIYKKFCAGGLLNATERPCLTIDLEVDHTLDLRELEQAWSILAPYGQGNPEPIFATREPCRLRNMQVIGKQKQHLRFSAHVADHWIDGIGFGFGNIASLNGERELPIAFSLKQDRYNGQTRTKIGLIEILFAQERQLLS